MSRSKNLPVGVGEKAQYLVHEFNDNTIRFVINYPGLIEPDILSAATKTLVESVDILHGSFISSNMGTHWHINEDVEESSYFQYIQTAGEPSITANSLALFPVSPESKAQLRCTLVQSHETSSVVLCISHLCADGGDGKYLLFKLAEAYNMILKTGSAESLEVKNGNRAPEQIYEKLDFKDIKSLLKNPISSVKTTYPYPTEDAGRLRMVRKEIPSEIMAVARKKAKLIGATANDLLITACYHAYISLPNVDCTQAVSVSSLIDLRRHCKNGESEGLCNMSGSLPTTLENGVQGNFADTLQEVAKQTRAIKDNPLAGLEGMPLLHGATRTLPLWLLLMVAGKIYGSFSIGLTNLGNLDCSALALGDFVPDGGTFGGPLKKKPAMQVSVISFDGKCVLSVVGQFTKEDSVVLQGTLDAMADEITKYASI